MASTAEALGCLGRAERRGASDEGVELELYPSLWTTLRAAIANGRVWIDTTTTAFGRATGARC
ncbi:MAG: hypothetical protein M3N53_06455 [Actinomycetota bacterium]|nr:hypothetical protein [Actinomycetota bacterium]